MVVETWIVKKVFRVYILTASLALVLFELVLQFSDEFGPRKVAHILAGTVDDGSANYIAGEHARKRKLHAFGPVKLGEEVCGVYLREDRVAEWSLRNRRVLGPHIWILISDYTKL